MADKDVTFIDVKVTAENIEDKTYVCNETGCLQQFNSEKSLKKHLCQHSDISPKKELTLKIMFRFNCPVSTCRRSLKMEKEYFTTRKHLFQHYFKVHNSGKFDCTNNNCDKKFSTELLRKLHLNNCGKTFSCHCGSNFNSNEALLTHQKRKHPTIARNRRDKVASTENNNNSYAKKKKLENPPTTRTVSTTTSGLGLWKSAGNLSSRLGMANTTSVFTSTDQPISSTSCESKSTSTAIKFIKNSSTSTAEDFTKEENSSNSLSSTSSQTKKTINWNSGDFDDSINLFDSDVKMEFYSAETQTDFTENLFNNNYTQTTFTDFSDFEKFDIQTQTNWDE